MDKYSKRFHKNLMKCGNKLQKGGDVPSFVYEPKGHVQEQMAKQYWKSRNTKLLPEVGVYSNNMTDEEMSAYDAGLRDKSMNEWQNYAQNQNISDRQNALKAYNQGVQESLGNTQYDEDSEVFMADTYQEGGQIQQDNIQQQFITWLAQQAGVKTEKELQEVVKNLGKEKLEELYKQFVESMKGQIQSAKNGGKYVNRLKKKVQFGQDGLTISDPKLKEYYDKYQGQEGLQLFDEQGMSQYNKINSGKDPYEYYNNGTTVFSRKKGTSDAFVKLPQTASLKVLKMYNPSSLDEYTRGFNVDKGEVKGYNENTLKSYEDLQKNNSLTKEKRKNIKNNLNEYKKQLDSEMNKTYKSGGKIYKKKV